MNNKGFAFSTILYGLLIMGTMLILLIMSTMQVNRQTQKNFVKIIEDELNRYSLTETSLDTGHDNNAQEYIVPMGQAGWYKIELWGGKGAGGSYGAYTSGMIYLEENEHIYFCIGKNGGVNSSNSTLSGGGSSDVRYVSGDCGEHLDSRIMVAAGAGGGGAGTRGNAIVSSSVSSSFGKGVDASGSNGAGGAGYYGGNAGTSGNAGHGGTSYISGFAGVSTKDMTGADATRNKVKYTIITRNELDPADVGHEEEREKEIYFINGMMLDGVSAGEAKAKIEKVIDGDRTTIPLIYNQQLYHGFRYVKDCVEGGHTTADLTGTKDHTYWKEIQVIKDGRNVANISEGATAKIGVNDKTDAIDGKIDTNNVDSGANTRVCLTLNLGRVVNDISEIAVWYDYTKETYSLENHSIEISEDGSSWHLLKDGGKLEPYVKNVGFHYTSWQPDPLQSLPEGTYYIQSLNGDNKFLTNGTDGKIKFAVFTGDSNQKWRIKSIDTTYYQIESVSDGRSLQIDTNAVEDYDNKELKVGKYVNGNEIERWRIEMSKNGYFSIKSGYDTCRTVLTSQYTSAGAGVDPDTYITSATDVGLAYMRDESNDLKRSRAQSVRFYPAYY